MAKMSSGSKVPSMCTCSSALGSRARSITRAKLYGRFARAFSHPQHAIIATAHGDAATVEPFKQRHRILARGAKQIAQLGHRNLAMLGEESIDPFVRSFELRAAIERVTDFDEHTAREQSLEGPVHAGNRR